MRMTARPHGKGFGDLFNPAPKIAKRDVLIPLAPPTGGMPAKVIEEEIPHVVHAIWLGPNPMPEISHRCLDSWQRCEGFTLKLWRDRDIEELHLHNLPLYRQSANYGEMADIARLEILLRCGGVYVDLDMECLRDIAQAIQGVTAFCGLFRGRIENAILGATQGHPFMALAVQSLPIWWSLNPTPDSVIRTGPRFIEAAARVQWGEAAMTYISALKRPETRNALTLFPADTFYPEEGFPGDALTHHHWTGSWKPAGRH